MDPTQQSSHDYKLLIKRWKELAKHAGLKLRPFAKAGEHDVHVIDTASQNGKPRTANREPSIYLSAGVHGDEAAPPWALLQWATENTALLKSRPFLLYPCMNPHGFSHNTRVDHRGVDINRTFHSDEPLIAAWRGTIAGRALQVGIHLHEDYDAQGIYTYELSHHGESFGHRILADCADIIAVDPRSKMDGRMADGGLIVRRKVPADLPGLPEAIELYNLGAPITLTFESPSEFALHERIAVQKRFIESSLRHVCGL